ncbi:hypothetical protein [Burkholderia sp. WAC0059]|uniref:hypothetical protein n=1 Tax=Burkholderia sp. WAC0059 TaxID=2066022 RepID=UPI000C7F5EBB|nr:hypothetical protein [Burkholderia sp. WAC0059]
MPDSEERSAALDNHFSEQNYNRHRQDLMPAMVQEAGTDRIQWVPVNDRRHPNFIGQNGSGSVSKPPTNGGLYPEWKAPKGMR